MTRKWDEIWLLTFIWNGDIINLYKTTLESGKVMKQKNPQGEKYYSYHKKQTRSIVMKKQETYRPVQWIQLINYVSRSKNDYLH
jgi:hypothetical protein